MIQTFIRLHYFAFLRESTEKPGDGAIIVAVDDGDTPRYWWVYAPRVDGVEYYPPQPEHRIVDPLSIQPGQRSRDYAGVQHTHKRVRLATAPVKLLAALEQSRQRQHPRIIAQRWRPIVVWKLKRCGLRLWRWGRALWYRKPA